VIKINAHGLEEFVVTFIIHPSYFSFFKGLVGCFVFLVACCRVGEFFLLPAAVWCGFGVVCGLAARPGGALRQVRSNCTSVPV
jgi:hypothetical protein